MANSHRKRRLARLTRPARHWLLVPLLEAARRLVAALPQGAALAIGRVLGTAAWLILGRQRRRAERQLEQAGLGRDRADRRAMVRRLFRSLGMNALEALNATGWSDEQFRRRVSFDRPEIIRAALARGRGVMPLTLHMGNWELIPRAYRLWIERPAALIMADQNDPRLTEWIARQRGIGGCQVLTTGQGALEMMRILRRGETLSLLADQDSTRGRGVFVEFFGRPAYTPVGPAHLARRCDSVILPMAIRRDPEHPHRHCVRVGEPIEPDPGAPVESEVLRLTQAYTAQLEAWIRADPGQWVWMHERWRHRPGKRVRVRSAGGRRVTA